MNHSCPQDFTVPPASRNVERFRRPRYHVDVRRTGGERRCWLALRDAFAVCLLLPAFSFVQVSQRKLQECATYLRNVCLPTCLPVFLAWHM